MKRMIRAAKSNSTTLEIMYDPYERYGSKPIRTIRVEGDNLVDALANYVESGEVLVYLDKDTIEEENMNARQIIQQLKDENGDGCDWIYYMKNLNTGKFLIKENYDEKMEETY